MTTPDNEVRKAWEAEVHTILLPAELVPDLEAQIVNQLDDLRKADREALRKKVEGMKYLEAAVSPERLAQKQMYNRALDKVLALLAE